ncbi:MAG: hypothetical protein IKT62_06585 [Firmicutes bacterium]|nr:hypothetical protein [Bacillota bacterium]
MEYRKKVQPLIILSVAILMLVFLVSFFGQNECKYYEDDARTSQRIPETYAVQVDKNDTYGTICFLFYDKDKTDFVFSFYTSGGGLFKRFSAGGAPLIDEYENYRIEEFSEYSLFFYNGRESMKELKILDGEGKEIKTYPLGDEPFTKVFLNESFDEIIVE